MVSTFKLKKTSLSNVLSNHDFEELDPDTGFAEDWTTTTAFYDLKQKAISLNSGGSAEQTINLGTSEVSFGVAIVNTSNTEEVTVSVSDFSETYSLQDSSIFVVVDTVSVSVGDDKTFKIENTGSGTLLIEEVFLFENSLTFNSFDSLANHIDVTNSGVVLDDDWSNGLTVFDEDSAVAEQLLFLELSVGSTAFEVEKIKVYLSDETYDDLAELENSQMFCKIVDKNFSVFPGLLQTTFRDNLNSNQSVTTYFSEKIFDSNQPFFRLTSDNPANLGSGGSFDTYHAVFDSVVDLDGLLFQMKIGNETNSFSGRFDIVVEWTERI